MRNSVSAKHPLSPAERSRLYRQRIRPPKRRFKIRVTKANIAGLVKRGYLGSNEFEDDRAIRQALGLFLWDSLLGAQRQIASGAQKNRRATSKR